MLPSQDDSIVFLSLLTSAGLKRLSSKRKRQNCKTLQKCTKTNLYEVRVRVTVIEKLKITNKRCYLKNKNKYKINYLQNNNNN